MKKRFLSAVMSLLLAFALVIGSFVIVAPAEAYALPSGVKMSEVEKEAEALKELGLFLGTNNGFELENKALRSHGIIMLIRILGEEEDALACKAKHPFTDVPAWADRYVAYAYSKGYTTGTSATTYSSNAEITAQQYVTFLLRALGYSDKAGDFTYAKAFDKAIEIGLMKSKNDYKGDFYRADIVHLSYKALSTETKNGIMLATELTFKIPTVEFFTALVKYGLTEDLSGKVPTPSTPSTPGGSSGNSGSSGSSSSGGSGAVSLPAFTTSQVSTNSVTIASNHNFSGSLTVSGNTVTANIYNNAAYSKYSLVVQQNGQWGYTTVDSSSIYDAGSSATLSVNVPSEDCVVLLSAGSSDGGFSFYVTDRISVSGGKFVLDSAKNFNDAVRSYAASSSSYAKSRTDIQADDASVKAMAAQITSGSSSNYSKALDIYKWVCQNITYSYGTPTDAAGTLSARSSVCQGYANLMAAMLIAEGIPARVIVGDSIIVGGSSGFGDKDYYNHAWVEFYDSGRWVICDPTSGGSYNRYTSSDCVAYAFFDMNQTYADSIMKMRYIQ